MNVFILALLDFIADHLDSTRILSVTTNASVMALWDHSDQCVKLNRHGQTYGIDQRRCRGVSTANTLNGDSAFGGQGS